LKPVLPGDDSQDLGSEVVDLSPTAGLGQGYENHRKQGFPALVGAVEDFLFFVSFRLDDLIPMVFLPFEPEDFVHLANDDVLGSSEAVHDPDRDVTVKARRL
jgi:hypothetical protein